MGVFYASFTFHILFGHLFPFYHWTFISLLSLDFYFSFIFGLLLSLFCLDFYFFLGLLFLFRVLISFLDFFFPFDTNRNLILDFFQVFLFEKTFFFIEKTIEIQNSEFVKTCGEEYVHRMSGRLSFLFIASTVLPITLKKIDNEI